VIEYENVLENSRKSEIISSIELKNGDTVFCSHFEDFNHVYLCKSSKHASSENNDVIIDFSKVTGKYTFLCKCVTNILQQNMA